MTQATTVGRTILAAFARGRAKAIQQAKARSAPLLAQIAYLALVDQAAGRPLRGRAGRISRRLGGKPKERWVRKIIGTTH